MLTHSWSMTMKDFDIELRQAKLLVMNNLIRLFLIFQLISDRFHDFNLFQVIQAASAKIYLKSSIQTALT